MRGMKFVHMFAKDLKLPSSLLLVTGSVIAASCFLAACLAPAQLGYTPKNVEEGYVVQTIQAMVEALNEGDADRFMSKVSTGYYKGYTQLFKRAVAAMDERQNPSLKIVIEELVIEDPKVTASISWKANWVSKETGLEVKTEGREKLVFMKAMGIKLIDHAGETLFGF